MKILFVDNSVKGHHVPYLKSLIKCCDDYICYLPEFIEEIPKEKQMVFPENCKAFSGYLTWINKVRKIANNEKVDIVHFLYGDIFYRFFGFGLFPLRGKTIITFHHVRKGLLHKISLKNIYKQIKVGIVHTEALLEDLLEKNIRNVEEIRYPVFEKISAVESEKAKMAFKLDPKVKTLLCFGGTRRDKGIDIFLEAIKKVRKPIQIIIAGKEEYFTKDYIIERLQECPWKSVAEIRYINEDEISTFFSASDVIVLPYRRIFDGASGPLSIGCVLEKEIVGPSHGSLGEIIRNNHLGIVFESENVNSLTSAIEETITEEFEYDMNALQYKNSLDVKLFEKKYLGVYQRSR